MKELEKIETITDLRAILDDDMIVKLYVIKKSDLLGGAKIAYSGTVGGLYRVMQKNENKGYWSASTRVVDMFVSLADEITTIIIGLEENL